MRAGGAEARRRCGGANSGEHSRQMVAKGLRQEAVARGLEAVSGSTHREAEQAQRLPLVPDGQHDSLCLPVEKQAQ